MEVIILMVALVQSNWNLLKEEIVRWREIAGGSMLLDILASNAGTKPQT